MLGALLLCALVGLGSSTDYETLHYGENFKIFLPRRAYSLTLRTSPDEPKVLWRSQRLIHHDPKHSLVGSYFFIEGVSQRNNGQYDLWDENNHRLSSVTITVRARGESYDLSTGDELDLEYDLPYTSCNVFFTPKDQFEAVELVRKGRVLDRRNRRISFYRPCHINMEVSTGSSGLYEVKDNNGDTALVVTLTVTDPSSSASNIPSYGWVGIAATISSTLCYCLKCCCCGKSSSKDSSDEGAEDAAENATGDADPSLMQYVSEPVHLGPRETVEELPHSTEPTPAPSTPLIHNSNISQPPSYEEALSLPEETGGTLHLLSSTEEPRFEFTGIRYSPAAPLSSETTGSDVYTSDKLNFL